VRRVQSTLFALFAASGSANAEMALNLTQGVSQISHDVYELHMLVFWICVAIGVVVFGAMLYSIIHHRKSKGAKPAEFHSHPVLEVTWTIVPALILILMAVPASKVLMNMNNDDKDDITIKVTGYQWKWHYTYLEDNISFFSNLSTPPAQMQNKEPKGPNYLREVDHPLVIPVHKKIRFLITSNDVNHAWWVPDFAVKRDAISGFINEAWTKADKTGTYYGQCAELCGVNHAFMPIVVTVMSEQGYKDWVAQQKGEATQGAADSVRAWTKQELMTKGEGIYNRVCAACHQPGGVGLSPTFPALKGSKVATGPIEGHIDTVFNGKTGTAMQAFKGQLSDSDIAAIITYERNSWGNNKGDMVQPVQIKALRDGKSMKDALATQPSAVGAATGKPVPPPPAPNDTKTPATTTTAAPAEEKVAVAKPESPEEAMKAAMQRGEQVYQTTCAACHQPTGLGMPPTFPALKGGKIVTGPVDGHIHQVVFGKPGTAMQAFMNQLTDQQIADVVTYERNSWGNNKGDLVKPDMVKAMREKGDKK
jgi:cytochrome c oxidase subunit 2